MNVKSEIEARLTARFAPTELVVVNESHLHGGHAGDDGSGESHFALRLRAPDLAGLSRLDRHRVVIRALGDIPTRVHALAMDLG